MKYTFVCFLQRARNGKTSTLAVRTLLSVLLLLILQQQQQFVQHEPQAAIMYTVVRTLLLPGFGSPVSGELCAWRTNTHNGTTTTTATYLEYNSVEHEGGIISLTNWHVFDTAEETLCLYDPGKILCNHVRKGL